MPLLRVRGQAQHKALCAEDVVGVALTPERAHLHPGTLLLAVPYGDRHERGVLLQPGTRVHKKRIPDLENGRER